MKKSLTQLMIDSGWERQERINAGKCYVEWIRDGYIVDEDDIKNSKEGKKK